MLYQHLKHLLKIKKQITIDMSSLDDDYNKHKMNELIIESGLNKYKTKDINEDTFNSGFNLLSSDILTKFRNATHITIETDDDKQWGYSYGFNLFLFLEMITSSTSSWLQIKIQQTLQKQDDICWINILWSLSSSEIQAAFNKKRLKIKKTQNKSARRLIEDCLTISRDSK
eukprot:474416_1